MDKKQLNFWQRMLNVVIWVPVLVAFVFYFKGLNHLLINLIVVFFVALCGHELATMLKTGDKRSDLFLYPLLASLFPLFALVTLYLPEFENYLLPMLSVIMLMVMARQIFVMDEKEFDTAISRITGSIFVLFYPGFFLSYTIKFASLPSSSYIYAFFLFLVMLNDGFAYFAGLAFGKLTNSKGFVLVSPNKSLVGFLGGIIASVLTAVFFYYFKETAPLFHQRSVLYAIFMGLICGLSSIVGDLFESTIKRSARIKDSGKVFMGRGGALDTFDSLAYAAPIFYYFLYFA